jgi:hypothetical protein
MCQSNAKGIILAPNHWHPIHLFYAKTNIAVAIDITWIAA